MVASSTYHSFVGSVYNGYYWGYRLLCECSEASILDNGSLILS